MNSLRSDSLRFRIASWRFQTLDRLNNSNAFLTLLASMSISSARVLRLINSRYVRSPPTAWTECEPDLKQFNIASVLGAERTPRTNRSRTMRRFCDRRFTQQQLTALRPKYDFSHSHLTKPCSIMGWQFVIHLCQKRHIHCFKLI